MDCEGGDCRDWGLVIGGFRAVVVIVVIGGSAFCLITRIEDREREERQLV